MRQETDALQVEILEEEAVPGNRSKALQWLFVAPLFLLAICATVLPLCGLLDLTPLEDRRCLHVRVAKAGGD